MRATAKECLRLAQPVLTALRLNDFRALRSIEDIYIDSELLIAELLDKVSNHSDKNVAELLIQNESESGRSDLLGERGATDDVRQLTTQPSDDSAGVITSPPDQVRLEGDEAAPTEPNLVNPSTPDESVSNSSTRKPRPRPSSKLKGKLHEAVASEGEPGTTALDKLNAEGFIKPSDEYL